MRVLQVGKYYPPHFGGMETVLRDLVAELSPHVELEVVVAGDEAREREDREFGVQIRRLGTVLEAFSQPVTPALPAALARAQADIVHIHEPNPWAMASYLAMGAPGRLVVQYHSDVVKQRRLGGLYRPVLEAGLRQAAAIVVGSQELIDSSPVLPRYASKCRVVPLGIDLRPFLELTRSGLDEGGPPRILAVGRLSYYKGFEYLVRAMALVPEAELTIVGEGELRTSLEVGIAQLGLSGRVKLAGRVDDATLAECYRRASVFCFPSCERSEAYGLAMVEAMAAGLPVVSTDLDTGVRFVNRDGETGLVVPRKDPAALAGALRQLLFAPGAGERRRKLGAAARERAVRCFSRQAMGEGVLRVYREVMAARPAAAEKGGLRRAVNTEEHRWLVAGDR